jgi:type II secretory pathway component PulF
MAIETRNLVATLERSPASSVSPSAAPTTAPWRGKDRMFFIERLALLLETGTPLHTGLETLAAQAASPQLSRVAADLAHDVASGLAFAEALRRQPEAFPETYASLVAAGERGGFLAQVLERLREMEESRQDLRSTLVGALSYPAFLIFFSIAVVIFVMVVVFPKFSELFSMIEDELPLTTLLLMNASDVLRRFWLPITGTAGGGLFLLWRWLRSRTGAVFVDRLRYRLPLLRSFTAEFHAIQFLRMMGLSLAHGVPVVEALQACRATVPSETFRAFVDRLEEHVTQGRGLAVGFREVAFLPALVGQMVATGEETGSLPRVMTRVADFYEREWRKRLAAVTKLIEPALLVLMGAAVGLIVSSLLLPIFKLSRAVG